jgi:hypothetical protein
MQNYAYRMVVVILSSNQCNKKTYIIYVSNKMQQCIVYILYFTAKLLYVFRVPFTPIIRSTGNCSCRPLVQVICHDSLEDAASNPLESIHSQATTTLHHGQIKSLNLTVFFFILFNFECLLQQRRAIRFLTHMWTLIKMGWYGHVYVKQCLILNFLWPRRNQ